MGQYHSVYNLDKKEYLHPHRMNEGAKLREWNRGNVAAGLSLLLSNSNGRGGGDYNVERIYDKDWKVTGSKNPELLKAIENIAGRWAGDRIVVQGDYAEKGDPAFITEDEKKNYKDISFEVMQALKGDL